MKRYLLDTAPLSAYVLGRPSAVALVAPWVARQVATTSVLAHAEAIEYFQGLAYYSRSRVRLFRVLNTIYPIMLPISVRERYGMVRRQLRPPHGPGIIGDIDTLIAATALEFGLTVVTTDSDFTRVPGLDVMLVSLKP